MHDIKEIMTKANPRYSSSRECRYDHFEYKREEGAPPLTAQAHFKRKPYTVNGNKLA